jgi:predicted dehydrogenase
LGLENLADKVLAPALMQIEGARLWSVLSRNMKHASEFTQKHGARAAHPVHTDFKKKGEKFM